MHLRVVQILRRQRPTAGLPGGRQGFAILRLAGLVAAPAFSDLRPRAGERDAGAVVRPPKLRTVDLRLAQSIRRGYQLSPSFKALVDAIESSNVIVYLERHSRFGGLEAGRLNLVGEAYGHRFLMISLNASLGDRELLLYAAHELHHAREIAERPDVVDQESLREFYCRIGHLGQYGFETEAAQRLARQVASELAAAER